MQQSTDFTGRSNPGAQLAPESGEELADLLGSLGGSGQTVQVVGRNSKRLMGGPIVPANAIVTTSRMRRVLRYERDDLTVSVQAGMPFSELQTMLSAQGQMLALDPPYWGSATIGGLLATNGSGSLRRAYGTARDLVIGMSFATLEGKLVSTGGMVVKNVAGLDIGKLMIGSFGTLAVITSANFRVHSLPADTRTFLFSHKDADSALQMRDSILKGPLQPMALDLLAPAATARFGRQGYLLAVRAGGSNGVLARYSRELPGAETLREGEEADFWSQVREFSSDFLKRQPGGIVLRVSTTLQELRHLLKLISGACVSRAGSGISYVYATNWSGVLPIWKAARERNWGVAVEFAPDDIRSTKELWLQSRDADGVEAFGIMEKVKAMFDPSQLLNRSRLYGRI